MNVPFTLYLITVISFIGSILFAVFAGVGLVALPIDLVNEYRERPRAIRDDEV